MKRAFAIMLILLPAVALADTVYQNRQIELSAAGIKKLEVTCGAGSFSLNSGAGLKAIRVTARIEVEGLPQSALQAFIAENVRLDLVKRGNKAILQSETEMSVKKTKEARINLSITVPDDLELEVKITDASGPIQVRNFRGNLEIHDDSGKIEIETIVGNVIVNDGSGSVLIEDVTGFVTIKDGSGSIEIYHIDGDVGVTDGSGDIKISDIGGNVTVIDASGDIDIKEVLGNVYIGQTGTGEVDVDFVGGRITIRE